MSASKHIDPAASYDELAKRRHPVRSVPPSGAIVAVPFRKTNSDWPCWRYLVIGCPHVVGGRHAWHHSEDAAQACSTAVRRAAGAKNHNHVLREMT